jgi:hypothetical protein
MIERVRQIAYGLLFGARLCEHIKEGDGVSAEIDRVILKVSPSLNGVGRFRAANRLSKTLIYTIRRLGRAGAGTG